eukprot:gene30106-35074_t
MVRAAFPDGGDMNIAAVKLARDRWKHMHFEEMQPCFDKADVQRYNTETAGLAGQVITSNQCPNTAYAGKSSRATYGAATGNRDGAKDPPGGPFLATPNSGPAQGGPFLATTNSGHAHYSQGCRSPLSSPSPMSDQDKYWDELQLEDESVQGFLGHQAP